VRGKWAQEYGIVRTLQRQHKVIQGIGILSISFSIVLLDIFINGFLDDLNGFLNDKKLLASEVTGSKKTHV